MKTKTVNVSLPKEVLDEIDRKAKEEYKSRSDVIREAALDYIGRQDFWPVFQKDMARRARELGIKTEDDVEEMIDLMRKK